MASTTNGSLKHVRNLGALIQRNELTDADILGRGLPMDIHLDSRSEHLIEQQLRSGRYQSPEQVIASALEVIAESEFPPVSERRRAIQDMLGFAKKHGFTLGDGLSIRDLIHEGHKY
jgi:hypothetical protein